MNHAQLLDGLAARGISLTAGPTGRPRLVDHDHRLPHTALLRLLWDRWLLDWALAGAATGHRWHRCSSCDEIQLLRPNSNRERPCILTFGCEGRMQPSPLLVPPPLLGARKATRPPAQPRPPARAKKRKTSSSHASGPARPARPGDNVTLVSCSNHPGARWVRSAYVDIWVCGVRTGDEPDSECGQPARLIAVGTLSNSGVPVVEEVLAGELEEHA